MHSLEQIQKQNERAMADAARHYCDAGRWVVLTYYGLSIGALETFSDEASAISALKQPVSSPDQRRILMPPTPAAQVVGQRDQSEDRPQPEQTLGQYVDRISRGL